MQVFIEKNKDNINKKHKKENITTPKKKGKEDEREREREIMRED